MINRRSSYMSGTRFHCRGIDRFSNASNFVETEEIVKYSNMIFSHVSIRGSVPVFWKQSTVGAEIRFTKDKDVDEEEVIKKHYGDLVK
jgi:hypothetical protein